MAASESPSSTTTDNNNSTALVIGQTRVCDRHGLIGTVQYEGMISNTYYWGVEWDDPSRGKHNGCVLMDNDNALQQLFVTHHPTGGSFVQPHKLDVGRMLTYDVVLERYTKTVIPLPQHYASTSSGALKPIELVGHELTVQQQQVALLTHISLRQMRINAISNSIPPQHLNHVTSLDVACNLLADWNHVALIFQYFPQLQVLSVALNRFHPNTLGTTLHHPHLIKLNLRGCHVTTTLLQHLHLPQLQELGLAHADLHDWTTTVGVAFESHTLRLLDVTACQLTSEHLVVVAQACPNLVELVANDNPITEWPLQASSSFTQLQIVHFSNTKFDNLQALQHIPPSIQAIKLDCDWTRTSKSARWQCIALWPNLQYYNGSIIQDREDIERHVLRRGQQQQDMWLPDHRYQELQHKHPHVTVASSTTTTTTTSISTLQDSLLTLRIVSFAVPSCTMPPLIRKVPLRLTIDRVQALIGRHFDIPIQVQSLAWRRNDQSLLIPIPTSSSTTSSMMTLEDCGMVEAAEIVVNEMEQNNTNNTNNSHQWHDKLVEEQQAERDQLERQKALFMKNPVVVPHHR